MIRVAMKSEWTQQRNDAITYFTRSRIFSALGTVLPKSLKIASRLDVREVHESWICESVIEIFWDEVFKNLKLGKYENHIWELRDEELFQRRSSQLQTQLLQLIKESLKKEVIKKNWKKLLEIRWKMDNLDVGRLSIENEALLHATSPVTMEGAISPIGIVLKNLSKASVMKLWSKISFRGRKWKWKWCWITLASL